MNWFWPCFSVNSGHVHQGLGDVGLKLGNKTVDQDAGLEREESKALSSEAALPWEMGCPQLCDFG